MLFKLCRSSLPNQLVEFLPIAQLLHDVDLVLCFIVLDYLDDVWVIKSLDQLYFVVNPGDLLAKHQTFGHYFDATQHISSSVFSFADFSEGSVAENFPDSKSILNLSIGESDVVCVSKSQGAIGERFVTFLATCRFR